jgi:hypothetical protein
LIAVAALALVALGCSADINLLGGREKCWPEDPPRAASLWRGILRFDSSGARLATPEGEDIPLLPGNFGFRVDTGELVQGSDVVARDGDDLTLFGGAGADGFLVVCAIEQFH